MHTPDYKQRQLFLLEPAVGFIVLFTVLIAFLRSIGYMVIEKESGNIDNLAIMGISKVTYLFSSLTAVLLFNFVIATLQTLLLTQLVITHTDFMAFLLPYLVFITIMISIAYFVSNFFFSAKKAIIFGIILFIFLEIPYVMRNKWKEYGANYIYYSTFSPIAGIGMVMEQILQAESNY